MDGLSSAIVLGGVYQHYKGRRYRVLGLARHSETLGMMVYYECLYPNEMGQMWVRPLEMFLGQTEVNGVLTTRFSLVAD